jgi:hypothetical protein
LISAHPNSTSDFGRIRTYPQIPLAKSLSSQSMSIKEVLLNANKPATKECKGSPKFPMQMLQTEWNEQQCNETPGKKIIQTPEM